MATFVDTNIWVYAYDRAMGEKREQAVAIIASSDEWVVSSQVLSEFFWVVTRKLSPPVSLEVARTATGLIARMPVVTVDSSLVMSAVDTSEQASIAFWDAMVVEAAVRGGCERIITEDLNHGQVIRGVMIQNPFLSSEPA